MTTDAPFTRSPRRTGSRRSRSSPAISRGERPPQVVQAVYSILDAAWRGEVETLRARLDAHPELIDALGSGFVKQAALHRAACKSQHACLRLLIERGADVRVRDFPDNAHALHVAAAVADLETIRILVEAGSDVIGEADDYEVGVLGWATCFRGMREDVAAYLLDHGARLNLWTAIALDRADAVRSLVLRDPGVLSARMTRNQHRRTALHHAAAKNRPQIVALLFDLGADEHNRCDRRDANTAWGRTPTDRDTRYDQREARFPHRREPAALRSPDAATGTRASYRWTRHRRAAAVSKRTAMRCIADRAWRDVTPSAVWIAITALHMTIENEKRTRPHAADAGADPDIRDDKYNATALGWADFFGREDFAQLVRDRGGHK